MKCAAVRGSLIALTLLSGSAIASAASPAAPATPYRTVSFADLDLAHAAGVAALRQRIRTAALEVCRPLLERDLTFSARSRSCVREAIARAENVANARATSQHLGNTHPPIVLQR